MARWVGWVAGCVDGVVEVELGGKEARDGMFHVWEERDSWVQLYMVAGDPSYLIMISSLKLSINDELLMRGSVEKRDRMDIDVRPNISLFVTGKLFQQCIRSCVLEKLIQRQRGRWWSSKGSKYNFGVLLGKLSRSSVTHSVTVAAILRNESRVEYPEAPTTMSIASFKKANQFKW